MPANTRHYVHLLLAAAAGAVVLAGGAWAQSSGGTTTYRWVDAQGVVHYSDTPQPGAQRLQIQPAQTFSDQALNPPAAAADTRAEATVYQSCLITQPSAQQSLFSPQSVTVDVQLVPRLRAGDQLDVTMDGKALSPVGDSREEYRVSDPDRGAHTVQAVVRSPDGRRLCVAQPVTFYVKRPSLLSPESPAQGRAVPITPPVPHTPTVPHS